MLMPNLFIWHVSSSPLIHLPSGRVTCYFSTNSFFNLMCCCCFICNCCVILTPIVWCVPTDMFHRVILLKYLAGWKLRNDTLHIYGASNCGMNAKLSCSFPVILHLYMPPLSTFFIPSSLLLLLELKYSILITKQKFCQKWKLHCGRYPIHYW